MTGRADRFERCAIVDWFSRAQSFDADLYEDVLRQTALSEADFGTLAEAAAAVFGRESGRAE